MKNTYIIILLVTSLGFYACEEEDPCEANQQLCLQEQYDADVLKIEEFIAAKNLEPTMHESGLQYFANNPGESDSATRGQFVSVDYVGKLLDGTVFDTSIDSIARVAGIYNENRTYQPFSFQLGSGSVIAGWDIGLPFFEEGGYGYLIIPSYLGYGSRTTASIPPNTVLYFEINLIDVKY
jgi:FKBP-type peptidyl-prolyl cis-trans isomerase FkpA